MFDSRVGLGACDYVDRIMKERSLPTTTLHYIRKEKKKGHGAGRLWGRLAGNIGTMDGWDSR